MKHLVLLILVSSILFIGCRSKRTYYNPEWIYSNRCQSCLSPTPILTYYDSINQDTNQYCLRVNQRGYVSSTSKDSILYIYDFTHLNPTIEDSVVKIPIISLIATNRFNSDSIMYMYQHGVIFPFLNLKLSAGEKTCDIGCQTQIRRKYRDIYGIMNYEFAFLNKDTVVAICTYNNAAGFISIRGYDSGVLTRHNALLKIDGITLDEYLRQSSPTSLLLFECPDTVQAETKSSPKKRKRRDKSKWYLDPDLLSTPQN